MKALLRVFVVLILGVAVGAGSVIGYLEANPRLLAGATVPARVEVRDEQPAPLQPAVDHKLGASISPAVAALAGEAIVIDVYERVGPSVVNITTRQARRQQSANPGGTPAEGTGSGFVIDTQGHILTNNHVVADASALEVTLADDTTVPARLIGRDPGNDLAVIKIDVAADKLRPIPLADSSQVKVGQLAIAIGNPFGLDRTVTTGVVSGVGRNRQASDRRTIRNMIQTDAPINPGNSGGPLLNARGEVIGINSSIESPVRGSIGIGFAVPSNTAKQFLPQLLAGGVVKHPWLGISGVAVTPSVKADLGLTVDRGVYLAQVVPNSPAAKADLRGAERAGASGSRELPTGGDVITAIDGKKIDRVEDIGAYLDTRKVGETITVTVHRGSESKDLPLTLGEWPVQGT